ncbi:MAG: TetR/AcrR family transcriptional regulator [Lachnospiraceae bacterium]|nr:TetR/AcrR family transcriptional regulator [Lachnospiraceae bacterium]
MNEVGKKMDRRVRKTKKQLLVALTTLMETKEIKNISVKELTDLADMNRGTFYLHYKDVFHMVESVENEFFQELTDILDHTFLGDSLPVPLDVLTDIFASLSENREICTALLGPHGDMAFVNKATDLVEKYILNCWNKMNYNSENFQFYFSFIISGCVGMMREWVASDFHMSSDKIAHLANDMVVSGIKTFC